MSFTPSTLYNNYYSISYTVFGASVCTRDSVKYEYDIDRRTGIIQNKHVYIIIKGPDVRKKYKILYWLNHFEGFYRNNQNRVSGFD